MEVSGGVRDAGGEVLRIGSEGARGGALHVQPAVVYGDGVVACVQVSTDYLGGKEVIPAVCL